MNGCPGGAHTKNEMTTKICIIGCGRFARYAHGPSYNFIRQNDKDVEYAACADISEEKAASFAAEFAIPRHYSNWREMAEKERPDGICLLTGVADTARSATEVLTEGIPLLISYPICIFKRYIAINCHGSICMNLHVDNICHLL